VDAGGHQTIPDAGGGGVDAGYKGIGTSCINNGTGTIEQSTCGNGFDCYPLAPVLNSTLTMCSKTCDGTATTNTCGDSPSGQPNVCLGGTSGVCYEGCDTSVAGSCSQANFACLPNSNTGTAGLCLPDCTKELNSFCASEYIYPFIECDNVTGDSNYGGCGIVGNVQGMECSATMACGSDQSCAPIPDQNPPVSACVTDCEAPTGQTCSINTDCQSGYCDIPDGGTTGSCLACPIGYSCSATDQYCELDEVPNYGVCVSPEQCPQPTDYCVSDTSTAAAGVTNGHCFTICGTGGSTCLHGQTCVTFQAGDSLCLLPCSPDAGPDFCETAAGPQTICDQGFCLPGTPPDAGTPTADAGTSDAGTADAGTPDAGSDDAGTPDAGP
jgi:hypothetical protein